MKEDFLVLCPVQALSKMMATVQQSVRRWLSQRTHKLTRTDVQLASEAQMNLQAALVSKTSSGVSTSRSVPHSESITRAFLPRLQPLTLTTLSGQCSCRKSS